MSSSTGKITAHHLQRRAIVYVRQSTAAQVHEHGESTDRQYQLTGRANELGWPHSQIEVIDHRTWESPEAPRLTEKASLS